MDESALHDLLERFEAGAVSADEVVSSLRSLPFRDLGFARIDHHRSLRQGMPEAVYAPGKTASECAAIVAELLRSDVTVLLSRADDEQVKAALSVDADAVVTNTGPRTATVCWRPAPSRGRDVVVVSAGTADAPVAAECVATLRAYGFDPEQLVDCGVAGLHRLLGHVERLQQAEAIVAIAGMEGALASVVGGLTSVPVVAVPTSVGYGASLQGVTALLAMLASCAAGITVVGIDNGYGAACAVARMLPTRRAT